MLFIIAVLAFLSAAFLLFRFTRRHDPPVSAQIPVSGDPPQNVRPLFAPTNEDIRRDTDAAKAREIARREYKASAKTRANIDQALSKWRNLHDAKQAVELLRVTATEGLDGDFSRAANEIVNEFRANGIDGLKGGDLAALLDSHSRLLPVGTGSSGELFWLRQEIARLKETNVSE